MSNLKLFINVFFLPFRIGEKIKLKSLSSADFKIIIYIIIGCSIISYIAGDWLKVLLESKGRKNYGISATISTVFNILHFLYICINHKKVKEYSDFIIYYFVLLFSLSIYANIISFFGTLFIPVIFPKMFVMENMSTIVQISFSLFDILFFIYCFNYVYKRKEGQGAGR